MTSSVAAALAPKCAASPETCGTPSGWRTKGRCPACRAAHNQETRDRRRAKKAPPATEVAKLAFLVENGADLTAAARHLGMNPRTARVAAQTNARVAAAVANASAPFTAARQQTYLLSLFHGGDTRASLEERPDGAVLAVWRSGPLFADAERSLRAWLASQPARLLGDTALVRTPVCQ
ncbi:hypothetical protein ACFY00_30780 [Kitasatospora sp. NPDC001540]|uniref:hypothetical protein n=1 Tax=Kitasatospora sp. NPDC001540 TaxID=3364014 RepID=UPI00368A84B7